MTYQGCLQALDGLQSAFQHGADIEIGLRSLEKHGFPMGQLVRFADARGFKKIASVGRRLVREDSGGVAQLPSPKDSGRAGATARDMSTGEGKPADAGESPAPAHIQEKETADVA